MTTITIAQGPTLERVKTHSGQTIEVMGAAEKAFYRDQQKKYLSENSFTAATDLQDLDRLLFFELMNYRYTTWLASGKNYYNELLTPNEAIDLRRSMKDIAPLISTIKNDLGLTKSQRDKAQYESVGTYLMELKARAMEFGVNREKQLGKALCLINELFTIVSAYDRANEIERQKLGFESADEVLDWVRDTMRPEYDEVDAHFRKNQQKAWVRRI